ncbi:MAG: SRPBCC family protein [Cyanobacteria bacterium J06626_18]
MSLLKKVVGTLIGLVVLVVTAGFLLPSNVHVERDLLMNAEPSEVFAWVRDFHAWDAWSPWAQMDPDAALQITGTGLGQTMTWSSENPQVGQGSQTIVNLDAPNLLKTHLDFGNQGVADATFRLVPEDGKTRVVWSLDTDSREGMPLWQQPVSTYFGFAMDAMIGKDYEAGLQNLKALAES